MEERARDDKCIQTSVGNSGRTAFGTLMRRWKDNPETGLEQNAGWFQVAQYRLLL
jgi:hypothetical protein